VPGIASQALGIAEAAYREADKYARERIQFGKTIRELPPVYEMLTEMRVGIEAGRTLLYETAIIVDLKEGLEHMKEKYPERAGEFNSDLKKYSRLANLLTPMVKAYTTELANKVAYDGIQIHGGPGYMKDFNAERHYRDARITNIYEGTTQLQIVAAIGGVTSGTASAALDEYDEEAYSYAPELLKKLRKTRIDYDKALIGVRESEDEDFVTFHSRRCVEMATDLVQGYLLLRDAKHSARKLRIAEIFIEKMQTRIHMNMHYILDGGSTFLKNYQDVLG